MSDRVWRVAAWIRPQWDQLYKRPIVVATAMRAIMAESTVQHWVASLVQKSLVCFRREDWHPLAIAVGDWLEEEARIAVREAWAVVLGIEEFEAELEGMARVISMDNMKALGCL